MSSEYQSWTYDAAVGCYKNHYISNRLLEVAVAKTVVVQFTQAVDGFGRGMGETVNIMHYKQLAQPTTAQLDEFTRIPVDKLELGNRTLTVAEFGRGVQYSSLMKDLGKFDPESYTQKALILQMNHQLDQAAAKAFQDGTAVKICFVPTSLTGGTFYTNGTPGTVATYNLTFEHCGVLRDYLSATIHCPGYQGDTWFGIFAPKSLRGLKQDNLWQSLHMYLQKGDLFFRSEVGQAENIRFIECNREMSFSNTAGSSTVLGQGVVFGDEAIARVEVVAPHLLASVPDDFGRKKAVAWYGIFVFGSYWNTSTDGEAKIIRVTSS